MASETDTAARRGTRAAAASDHNAARVTDTPSVLNALTATRADGRSRDVNCPAHDDRRASLSIGRGDDGRILLHCYAQCETEAVLKAVSLKWTDPTPPRRNGSGREQSRVVATYS